MLHRVFPGGGRGGEASLPIFQVFPSNLCAYISSKASPPTTHKFLIEPWCMLKVIALCVALYVAYIMYFVVKVYTQMRKSKCLFVSSPTCRS